MASDLVAYHRSNPDPAFEGCMNGGGHSDGVVFLHVEPLVGAYTFIGRQSIIEAVAELYAITPAEVHDLLEPLEFAPAPKGKIDLAAVQETIQVLCANVDALAADAEPELPAMQPKPKTGARG